MKPHTGSAGHSAPFGLYVHWPFCQSKCPYCDFNSHVAASVDHHRWSRALCSEVERIAAVMPNRLLTSIFFGGGTPSLMLPETVHSVIEAARKGWRWANSIEITLEANPGSVEAGRFRGYRDAGVNRVSLGIQALNDADLRALGRNHTRTEALFAIDVAQSTFERVSIDLIYARQNQSGADWRSELSEALSLGLSHLSLYQLTIEDGTVFARRHKAGMLLGLPDEDFSADLYSLTQEVTDRAGLPAYEISNHACEGEESQHNMLYWRGGAYGGIGPGAHGRLEHEGRRIATEAIRAPDAWLRSVETAGSGDRLQETLNRKDRVTELLLMGLRITDGVSVRALRTEGVDMSAWPSLQNLTDSGMLRLDEESLRVAPEARLLLNSVIEALHADIPIRS